MSDWTDTNVRGPVDYILYIQIIVSLTNWTGKALDNGSSFSENLKISKINQSRDVIYHVTSDYLITSIGNFSI